MNSPLLESILGYILYCKKKRTAYNLRLIIANAVGLQQMIPPLIVKLIHHIYGMLKTYLQDMVEIKKEHPKINSLKNKKICTANYTAR